jgi:YolD-like protein
VSIRDRGNKKWTSLMLPEHVEQLRDFFDVEYYKVEKPVLDEQQLEEMNDKINEAMEYTLQVCFRVYKNGQCVEVIGYIHYVDPINQTIYVINKTETRIKLKIEDVIDMKFVS